jgi:IS30 family transposase
VERLSVKEKGRIAELLAEGVPVWQLHQEVNRSRFAIRRAVRALLRPPAPQRQRSPLRLSLSEREEISRGLAAGDSLRHVAERLGRAPSTVSREVTANGVGAPIGRVALTGLRGGVPGGPGRRSWRRAVGCGR